MIDTDAVFRHEDCKVIFDNDDLRKVLRPDDVVVLGAKTRQGMMTLTAAFFGGAYKGREHEVRKLISGEVYMVFYRSPEEAINEK